MSPLPTSAVVDRCEPAPDLIHVRWLPMLGLTGAAMSRGLTLLDHSERARADRFAFEADRNAFIAAHALARAMLGSIGGRDPASWRYVAGRHGKPEIAPGCGPAGLRFSISHARTCVACAVGWHDDVGIDVESLDRPQLSLLELADRFFAPAEAARVRDAPAADVRRVFFALWTLKEAFIKATGDGLTRRLDSFSFSHSPIAVALSPDSFDADPLNWHFMQVRTADDHFVAVAVSRRVRQPPRFDARAMPSPERAFVDPLGSGGRPGERA